MTLFKHPLKTLITPLEIHKNSLYPTNLPMKAPPPNGSVSKVIKVIKGALRDPLLLKIILKPIY